jgi:hypothetical protein
MKEKHLSGKARMRMYCFEKFNSSEECSLFIKEIFWLFIGMSIFLIFGTLVLTIFDIWTNSSSWTTVPLSRILFFIEGVFLLVATYIYAKNKNLVLAMVMLPVVIAGTINSLTSPEGYISRNPMHFIFGLILTFFSIHLIRATFAYHKLKKK